MSTTTVGEREINEAIARFYGGPHCGVDVKLYMGLIWVATADETTEDGRVERLELFTRSLAAMALVEAKLDGDQQRRYKIEFFKAVVKSDQNKGWLLITAPASLRAAALYEALREVA